MSEADSTTETIEIPLNQEKVALVDRTDWENIPLLREKWTAYRGRKSRTFYAEKSCRKPDGRKGIILMHRVILAVPFGVRVDHRDGNGLNNCRSNLRVVTHQQNLHNMQKQEKSLYKGVHRAKGATKWTAYITCDDKRTHLGQFFTPEEAAHAYNAAALRLFGEFARLNVVPS